MPLSLYQLLDRCTVKLIPAQSKNWGTGFFVAKGKIITCAHVVQSYETETISVLWKGQKWATAKIEQIQPSPIDLALLQVEMPEGEHPPCVLLDEAFNPFDKLYIYGYPDDFPDGGSVTIDCEGEVKDRGVALLKAKAGQVRPGHSGSPALNNETRKVCGIVSETRGRSTDFGGLLIPTSTVFKQFPELKSQNNELHQQDRHWINLIQQEISRSNTKPSVPSYNALEDVPDVSIFFGRTEELSTLEKWAIDDRCRLVAVLGIGGIGKTALAAKLTGKIKKEFEYTIWQSLRDVPPVIEILGNFVKLISKQSETDFSEKLDSIISRFIHHLRSSRCLIVLDNVETLFRKGEYSGNYLEGYEGYGELIRRVRDSKHNSCLILTSRESFQEIGSLSQESQFLKILQLGGLNYLDGKKILKRKNLFSNSESDWKQIVEFYAGNPLALQVVSETIKDDFSRNTSNFLKQGARLFENIQKLANEQYNRLSDLEKEIMYWLAINREPVSLENLKENDIITILKAGQLIDIVHSLRRRHLIENTNSKFTQHPVIMEYIINRFIDKNVEEIKSGEIKIFNLHPLIKAQTQDYLREAQIRLILQPIIDKLINELGGKRNLENHLHQILSTLQEQFPLRPGYAGANILNILCQIQTDLRNYDFSSLTIRQAYLRGVYLPNVNFASANLERSVFSLSFVNVLSVAFSPDSSLLATGDTNGEIRIWKVSNGQLLFTCQGHTNWVRVVAFSPDGKTLASGSTDRTVKLWDVATGHCLQTLEEHTNWIWSISFSPDSKVLASASDDKTVKLWDISTTECLKTLLNTHWVRSIAFASDNRTLASGSVDQIIRLWDTQTGECINHWQERNHVARSATFRIEDGVLATGGDDAKVRLLDLRTGECLKVFEGHIQQVWSVAFSPDGKLLASGSADRQVRLWNIETGDCLNTFDEQGYRVRSLAFSPDGKMLATGSDDQRVSLWNVCDGKPLKILQGYTQRVWSVAFSPDGTKLVSGADDKRVRLWDVKTGECLQTLTKHAGRVRAVAFSSDGKTIISASNDRDIILWDMSTGKCRTVLSKHKDWVSSMAISRDGTRLVSVSDDKTVLYWDIVTGQYLKAIGKHTNWIWSIALSSDSKIIATASEDNNVKLWDVMTGNFLKSLPGHTDKVRSVSFSKNGKMLASGSDDRTVKVWDILSNKCIHTFRGHTSQVRSVAFSPNSKFIASGSDDRTIRLWRVNSNVCYQAWDEHTKPVWSVAFSPDGKTLASGSEDETIKLWDIKAGICRKTLRAERPYEGLNITGVTGINEAQKTTLKVLGAVEY